MDWSLPRIRIACLYVWQRNVQVWRRLLAPALLMNLGEPLLYLLGMGYGLGFFIDSMSDIPYITFLASGIVASAAMYTASFEGMYSVFTRMDQQGTYEAMLAAPMDCDDIIAGEMLWCATKALISGVAIILVALALGAVSGWQILWVIPILILAGLCFAGPAIVMSAMSTGYDFFNFYFTLFVTPMLILSGVFYPVDVLPDGLQAVVQALPLSHAVALIRPLMAGTELTQIGLHLGVLSLYAVVGFYLAVVMVRRRLIV